MPANMTHYTGDAADVAAVRRALLTAEATADLTAARQALARLDTHATQLQARLETLDDDALQAARRQARDLRQCAEALAEGV